MGRNSRRPPPTRLPTSKDKLVDHLRAKHAESKGDKTICLTMIVRNESKNMTRLLDSLVSIIDMISIVDTGSTDDTIDIIKKWGKTANIPTTVHTEPFQDFAYNRTHSVKMAQQTYPQADYLLLSDADFVWEINVGLPFNKKLLYDHKYMIEQYNNTLRYWNVRLLAAKVKWVCVGCTHEYWVENKEIYDGEVRTQKIKTLVIHDLEDGGCKDDKFERDERLLRKGIADPNTPSDLRRRYYFYLAQTLRDLKKYKESIQMYEERIKCDGWPEEIYYAKSQIGFNYENLAWKYHYVVRVIDQCTKENREFNDNEKEHMEKWNSENLSREDVKKLCEDNFKLAENSYLEAHRYRPTRSESLYALTRMFRMLGKHQEAYDIAQKGKPIPYPSDSLFVEYGCYKFLFDYEISIVSYYIEKHKSEGQKACEKLLEMTDLPPKIRAQVEKNCGFYI